jgi:predicted transcriptional regulator
MLTKDKVLEAITNLPEEFSLDDLMDRLIILEKIERGLAEVAKGETVSQEEAKVKMNKWLK